MEERFGKYVLHSRLGVGGMAEVYLASTSGPEGFEKEVCIKRILPAFGGDPEFVRMFIREARLAARLTHGNIVQIFDFDQLDGAFFLAMELVRGADLRRVIRSAAARGRPLPVQVAAYVVGEILKALRYAHGYRGGAGGADPVIHRDVSPHNVLLSFSGEVKLSDFGIAKATSAGTSSAGITRGKLGYIAPEQVDNVSVDGRADLYATGVVLYELLTARRFRTGETEAEQAAQLIRGDTPPLPPGLPDDLAALLRRLCARNLAERPASAGEALTALCGCSSYRGDGELLANYLAELLPDEVTAPGREPTRALVAAPAGSDTRTQTPMGTTPRAGELTGAAPPATPARARLLWGGIGAATAALGVLLLSRGQPVVAPQAPASGTGGATMRPAEPAPRAAAQAGPAATVEPAAAPAADATPGGPRPAQSGARTTRPGAADSAGEPLRPAAVPAPAPVVPPPTRAPEPAQPRDPLPRTEDRPRKASRDDERGERGFLSVTARPWAMVYVDGAYVQQTPILRRPLSAGKHTVEVRNDELDRRSKRVVEIHAGQELTITERFD